MNLTVENGAFRYNETREILRDLSFSVSSGDLMAILGPNGAGKTTLLRCIMGFLKWTGGESLLDGEPIRAIPSRRLWRRIAYVPQAKGAFSSFTAEEMILLGRTGQVGLFSAPSKKDMDEVLEIMDSMCISHLVGQKCNKISGGELQMVLIARALSAKPELLILDEPESNLDFKNQLIVLNTLSRLSREGMCCIFNTHYPSHALTRANKSLLLCRGGDCLFGDTPQVVTEENIQWAFGVRAVIGDIETDGNQYKSIIPLSVTAPIPAPASSEEPPRLAVLAVITSDYGSAGKINGLLHRYSDCFLGRMGIPYRDKHLHVLSLTMEAPRAQIETLSQQLGLLPGVNVKVTYADTTQQKGTETP